MPPTPPGAPMSLQPGPLLDEMPDDTRATEMNDPFGVTDFNGGAAAAVTTPPAN